jgi:hypothetical protein
VGRWSAQLAGALATIAIQRIGSYVVSNEGRFTNAGRRLLRAARVEQRCRDALPTTKWWVATMIASAGFILTPAFTGRWTRDLTGALIAITGQRVLAYVVPNSVDE